MLFEICIIVHGNVLVLTLEYLIILVCMISFSSDNIFFFNSFFPKKKERNKMKMKKERETKMALSDETKLDAL
jgi:hypothetical protein